MHMHTKECIMFMDTKVAHWTTCNTGSGKNLEQVFNAGAVMMALTHTCRYECSCTCTHVHMYTCITSNAIVMSVHHYVVMSHTLGTSITCISVQVKVVPVRLSPPSTFWGTAEYALTYKCCSSDLRSLIYPFVTVRSSASGVLKL